MSGTSMLLDWHYKTILDWHYKTILDWHYKTCGLYSGVIWYFLAIFENGHYMLPIRYMYYYESDSKKSANLATRRMRGKAATFKKSQGP